MSNKIERWYRFSGNNFQACYGWGTEAEARAYAARLNRDRGVNLCGFEPLAESNEAATAMCTGLVDISAEGVNLAEALAAIND